MSRIFVVLLSLIFVTTTFNAGSAGAAGTLLPEAIPANTSMSPGTELFERVAQAVGAQGVTSEVEAAQFLFRLEKTGQLRSRLVPLITSGLPLTAETREQVRLATLVIRSELYSRGFTKNFRFKDWDAITQLQEKRVSQLPQTTNFRDLAFRQTFESVAGTPFARTNNLRLVQTGPRSMNLRMKMVESAQSSINMLVWGWHDDQSGRQMANALIQVQRDRDIPVRVIVDGLNSQRKGYGDQLKRMTKAGVEVIRWKGKANPFYGMHSKMLMVDERYFLEGGRNVGDHYLAPDQWTDLEIAYEGGSIATINYNHFARMFNDQVALQDLNYSKLPLKTAPVASGKGSIGTLIHFANQESRDPIYEMTLYAINNAKNEIEIANAYFITTPSFRNALVNAINRGVKVRIFTNSDTSLDEPALAVPILRSVKELAEMGAEVFLKQGETLHTKMFRADDLAWVGSYNWHPRSHHYEVEKATFFNDSKAIAQVKENFNSDILGAIKITDPATLAIPSNTNIDLALSLFFNQL